MVNRSVGQFQNHDQDPAGCRHFPGYRYFSENDTLTHESPILTSHVRINEPEEAISSDYHSGFGILTMN
jgi:hypothetical protein